MLFITISHFFVYFLIFVEDLRSLCAIIVIYFTWIQDTVHGPLSWNKSLAEFANVCKRAAESWARGYIHCTHTNNKF